MRNMFIILDYYFNIDYIYGITNVFYELLIFIKFDNAAH